MYSLVSSISLFYLNFNLNSFLFCFLILIFWSAYGIFVSRNIIFAYLCTELFVLIILFFFIFFQPYWLLYKVQSLILLIFGLIAAELAVGLALFIKFHRISSNIEWSEIKLGE